MQCQEATSVGVSIAWIQSDALKSANCGRLLHKESLRFSDPFRRVCGIAPVLISAATMPGIPFGWSVPLFAQQTLQCSARASVVRLSESTDCSERGAIRSFLARSGPQSSVLKIL